MNPAGRFIGLAFAAMLGGLAMAAASHDIAADRPRPPRELDDIVLRVPKRYRPQRGPHEKPTSLLAAARGGRGRL